MGVSALVNDLAGIWGDSLPMGKHKGDFLVAWFTDFRG